MLINASCSDKPSDLGHFAETAQAISLAFFCSMGDVTANAFAFILQVAAPSIALQNTKGVPSSVSREGIVQAADPMD